MGSDLNSGDKYTMSVTTAVQTEHAQQAPYTVKAKSRVLEVTPALSPAAFEHFSRKLEFETDCSDVYASFASGTVDFVLLDVRNSLSYTAMAMSQGPLMYPC